MFTYKEFIEEKFDYTKQEYRNKSIKDLKTGDFFYTLSPKNKIFIHTVSSIDDYETHITINATSGHSYIYSIYAIDNKKPMCLIREKKEHVLCILSTNYDFIKMFSESKYNQFNKWNTSIVQFMKDNDIK